jgi:hypothetical protein
MIRRECLVWLQFFDRINRGNGLVRARGMGRTHVVVATVLRRLTRSCAQITGAARMTTEDYAFRASRSWIILPFTVRESCLYFGAAAFAGYRLREPSLYSTFVRVLGYKQLRSRAAAAVLLPPGATPIHSIIVT